MRRPSPPYDCLGRFSLFTSVVAAVLLCPATVNAGSLGGFLEYSYSLSDSTTTNSATGASSTSNSNSMTQRYFLTLDQTLYPQLRFTGGAFFEKTDTTSETDGITTDSSGSRFIPRGDLTLSGRTYTAGVGYNRRIDGSKTNDVKAPDSIVENSSARFSLKPEGLPTLNFFFSRTNYFDEKRTSRDTTMDSYNLSSNYRASKDLFLSYLGQYTKQTDNLNKLETTVTSHNARVAYSRQFLRDRVSLNGTYNISQQHSENLRLIATPFLITVAVSTSSDVPQDTNDTTNIDFITPSANLTDGSGTQAPDASPKYLILATKDSSAVIGNDYYHFGIDTQVASLTNAIFVTVNQNVTNIPISELRQELNSWEVYYSKNNVNDWQKIDPSAITFHPTAETIGVLDNSYEIRFHDITARYFKVVIKPRKITTDIPALENGKEVYLTEIHTFRRIDESTKSTSLTSLSHQFNLNGQARLYDPYNVIYEFSYSYNRNQSDTTSSTRTDSQSSSRYTLSNALRAQHRFSSIVTGSARISREDSVNESQNRTAFTYSASLQANPLPNLNHTLVYSGRTESTGSASTSSNSLVLNNTATPYRGVNLYLSATYNSSTGEANQQTDTISLGLGSSLTPNPKFTLNMNYAGTNLKQSGGGIASKNTTTHRGDIAATFTPVPSIHLYGSYGIQTETGRQNTTIQSFGGSWGILRGGALQLNISYSESLRPTSNQKDRTLSPSMRWNIRRGTYLDISYLISNSTNETQEADFTSFSALLRIGF